MDYKITVLPYGRTVEAEENSILFDVLRDYGMAPESPCGGRGTCGKCRVIVDGQEVLSCRTRVTRDITVELPEQGKTRVLTAGTGTRTELKPYQQGNLIAFDIGTTTVVCFLLDGLTGRELANSSMLNPQQPFGADVISRIQAAMSGNMQALTDCIRRGMTELIRECCRKAGVSEQSVSVLTVVANPCMQQLFMGILPRNLATIPFDPAITKAEAVSAADYLPVCPNARLLVVPDLSGYVGSDTMGCVLSTEMYKSHEKILMVDIGTNGEMVLGGADGMIACSTAAGPALEGANIRFGMRGAPGAIDHVKLENGELVCTVIGGGKARGICGSGLIDAVACALEAGLINKRGRIQDQTEWEGERFIPLRDGVVITQQDIREVQLAKGAIAAGIQLMAKQMNMEMKDVDHVLLAGAFGSFMDPKNACRIGLLPPQLIDRVKAVGNAAGSGAVMISCNGDLLQKSQQLVEQIRFLELAKLPEFQMTFAMAMSFQEPEEME